MRTPTFGVSTVGSQTPVLLLGYSWVTGNGSTFQSYRLPTDYFNGERRCGVTVMVSVTHEGTVGEITAFSFPTPVVDSVSFPEREPETVHPRPPPRKGALVCLGVSVLEMGWEVGRHFDNLRSVLLYLTPVPRTRSKEDLLHFVLYFLTTNFLP